MAADSLAVLEAAHKPEEPEGMDLQVVEGR